MANPRRRLTSARERLPDALIAVAELRRAMEDGKPLHVQLTHLEEIEEALYAVEGEVGCAAPANLFE